MISTTQNFEITAQARESLKGKWGTVVGATLIYILFFTFIQMIPGVGQLIWLGISGAISLGLAFLFLNICRNKEAGVSQLFSGFNNFLNALIANLLMSIFIFLWALLLIIPGIIAAYSYMLTFYILSDDPSLTPSQAIKKSKDMMKGYKLKAFFLSCRFIGWAFLALLTGGLGYLFLIPYAGVSFATFYEDIKKNQDETLINNLNALSE